MEYSFNHAKLIAYFSLPSIQLSCHLVEPLLCMVGELQRRQLELNKLLIKKDKEIQDYKDQGTLVSRSKSSTSGRIGIWHSHTHTHTIIHRYTLICACTCTYMPENVRCKV